MLTIESNCKIARRSSSQNVGRSYYLDAERFTGSLELRNWRPGDQYQAQGRADAGKIKSLFQEFRVPLWERRNWPVITGNGA